MILPTAGINADAILSDICATMDVFSIAISRIRLRLVSVVSTDASAAHEVIHEVELAEVWTKAQFDLGEVGHQQEQCQHIYQQHSRC